MLQAFSYVKLPAITGSTEADCIRLLRENGHGHTAEHCLKVAETCSLLAEKFGLDRSAARLSGILHDVSAVIKPDDMMRFAISRGWYIDECEKKYNSVLHQRVSRVVAEEYFGILDENILSAIECHSTLKRNPSQYDRLLFLADKISWDQDGVPPFHGILTEAVDVSLAFASLTYIDYALGNGLILYPHKWLLDAKKWLEKQLVS